MIVHDRQGESGDIASAVSTKFGWVVSIHDYANSRSLLVNDKITVLGKPVSPYITKAVAMNGRTSSTPLRFPFGYFGEFEVVMTPDRDLSTNFTDALVLDEPKCDVFLLNKNSKNPLIKMTKRLVGVEGQAMVVMNDTNHAILQPTKKKIMLVFPGNETILAITKHQLFLIDNPLV